METVLCAFLVHRTSHTATQSAAQVHVNKCNFKHPLGSDYTPSSNWYPRRLDASPRTQVPSTSWCWSPLFPVERKTWTFHCFSMHIPLSR
ncbi:Uncharacterized protein HZ326_10094 [Fusarium oxysporum f. sp. albedinis]|nr:Uncharacterized protein HZ326_10094 [Fusarium oxysporum f. sp. albedinis]